jgi:hypothetical protein
LGTAGGGPYHYFGEHGYIRSDEEWRSEFQRVMSPEIQASAACARAVIGRSRVKTAFLQARHAVCIRASVWRLYLVFDEGWITLNDATTGSILISRSIDDFWAEISTIPRPQYGHLPDDESALDPATLTVVPWVEEMLTNVLCILQDKLAYCVERGAAHIMARQNSPLAPFERVQPDQWVYFTLDSAPSSGKNVPWCDPRLACEEGVAPESVPTSNATGPNGEKLYSIHIAPGDSSRLMDDDGGDAGRTETYCANLIWGVIKRSPHRATHSKEQLYAMARHAFPRLSRRGFDRALGVLRKRPGFPKAWGRPGPRAGAKSPQ